MEILALLSKGDDFIVSEVKDALKGYTVYPLKTLDELEELHSNIPLKVILIDTVSYRLSSLDDLLSRLHEGSVVLITPEKLNRFNSDNLPRSIYECIDSRSIRRGLLVVVERALERQRFKNELELLKRSKNIQPQGNLSRYDAEAGSGYRDAYPGGRYIQEKVLINFAKMLTAMFDMNSLFNHFMDSILGIARVSKMSVMLREEEGFCVKVHYGLDPYLAENIRLKKDSALATCLSRTGRIIIKPVNPADASFAEVTSEMNLLQCSFSFPMIYKGNLIGIFNIDNKITEEPFFKEELETIYILCNYLAAAVKEINLYHQIWYQKEFTKNVLSSMSSGMIAIDRDEKITVFNPQASEILNLEPAKILGSDLRSLPSPMGDILYETMTMGTAYKRYEVEVGPDRMPLGINSCRLVDENQEPVGAGIIFSDLSDSKKLELQKRQTERLEAVNKLIGKIAHEIRTPLTSIQTYTQILGDKYRDDEELNNFFSATVLQSIQKLDSLLEKLVIFSSKTDYNLSEENAGSVIKEVAEYVSKNIPRDYKILFEGIRDSVLISVDKRLLIKAIHFFVLYIVERSKKGSTITMSARVIMKDPPGVEILLKYSGEEISETERKNLLTPLHDIDGLGTEMNMPISHKIIEGHEGSIDIQSEEGSNTFIIRLPAVDRRASQIPLEVRRIDRQ
ncbi:MAG: PAS domain-containing protein [Nitrospirae bacterium]|nr:PAS domain-containing protein [Nitrospirota bacterium]